MNNYKEVHDNYLGSMVFPIWDKEMSVYIESHGTWSEPEKKWLIDNIKNGDVCLNVGANVGYFTCLMSKLTGTEGKVISIEANPLLEEYIRENVRRTNSSNVRIIMSAAGESSGVIDLYINSTNAGDNRVHNPKDIINPTWDHFDGNEVITVNIDKVDSLVLDEKIDIVFMDCQGWDHKIFRGMSEIIKRDKPKIMMEYVPKWISNMNEDPLSVLNEFASSGYSLTCPEININTPTGPEELLYLINDVHKKAFVNICLT